MIVACDLSQIEWRVAAVLSQDPVMLQEIRNKIDQHAATCTDLMELELNKPNRDNAKVANFRMIYANPETSWYGYYMDPKMPDFDKDKWKAIVKGFFDKYSGLAAYHQRRIEEVRQNGFYQGPTGRIWKFEKSLQRGGYLDYDVGQIRNYDTQGTAGDLMKLGTVHIQNRRKKAGLLKSKVMIVVHDDLVWDCPEEEAEDIARISIETFRDIPRLAKRQYDFDINCPIDAEASIGPRWGEMEKYNYER